ncbi:uncharacterized protein DS421_6g182990 [Arachis hypogaea]|nr:uncharacterized protein DS421_6g182990 [Arachis hypogaea]
MILKGPAKTEKETKLVRKVGNENMRLRWSMCLTSSTSAISLIYVSYSYVVPFLDNK